MLGRYASILPLALWLGGCASASAPPSVAPAAMPRPAHYIELEVGGVITTPDGPAVVLLDPARQVAVPIFVGDSEALAIALRNRRERFPRPLTHDLLDAMLDRLGGTVVKIQIDEIRDEAFIGAVYLQHGSEVFALDARPSDAIALALGHRLPIFIHEAVVTQAGIEKPPPEDPPGTI